ncbi:chemotaxis protein CheB [Frigidibacter sp.]|uniref:chemotaxis protein CheB n=1 Tax=Frigidibacter sp. TaxID=2586418 RepID=UPI00273304D1|nr:chemotaxis protein CheB [Frigidibacter sp.]MDP3340497.1 chemotaxis protein CheB [Frigidibacter sp.]
MSAKRGVAPIDHLPVIAIGASAGGLEACSALLKVLPGDIPAAFVLILHLDPSHDSMMVDLLARDTSLSVVLAADGMVLRPAHFYIIPPGVFLTVKGGIIHAAAPHVGKAVRLPFDVLLQSLAKNPPSPLACIILSGTGADGSGGLGAIHRAGGVILAQDPQEAGYPGMPESAIGTGFVDQVLKVSDMPEVLAKLAAEPSAAPPRAKGSGVTEAVEDAAGNGPQPIVALAEPNDKLDAIIALVAKTAPQDVSLYKTGTIHRRIARRMALAGCGLTEAERYLAVLIADPAELAQLSADLLIHITSFFRDPAVFLYLAETALPGLIATLPPDRPLRIWVAGCSTGEEAYSLAMLCLEAVEAAGFPAGLQVFASDIDADAVALAREGFYPAAIENAVSAARLARFFRAENGGWRVRSELRDVIVFTVADLLSDPPFSRMDLVSCRNLLIYLEPAAQSQVIGLFSFALQQGGLLLLGAAETPGPANSRFEALDKNLRLWRCIGPDRSGSLQVKSGARIGKPANTPLQASRRTDLEDLCRRIVLDNYAPAAVLLNRRLDCLYLLGPTERFLSVTRGHPDPGILGMLPKTLRARFRVAAAECDAANPFVIVPGHPADDGRFNIELRSVSSGAEQLLLACFVPVARALLPERSADPETDDDASRIAKLEATLDETRKDLRDALHDLELEVEAHAADTAEALSVNEEFQSTNEELLASKEELQALNEELTALNAQLQETLERHRTTANDLQNVLYSTDVATLFLDADLNIRFFTPRARTVFRVIATDIGRPLADLAALSTDENLAADAAAVLHSSEPVEREISGAKDVWFLRRIQPYRTDDGHVEGVVITFIDITERKRTHAALVAAKRQADRATTAKSRFLAAASHDLRQPLQSLALLHGLMARGRHTVEAARLAALLDRTLESMTDMLDSLLDVNRIESGIVRPQVVSIAIAPLLQRLADEFAPLCAMKGLRLRLVPSSAWVATDPQLLEQILRNLLSNALKYTVKGGILIGCRRQRDHVTVQICDTGIGVPEQDRGAIFDAYHQGEASAHLPRQGLGLGLSIVQQLAKLLHHPLGLKSTVGKGSAFMITLPVVAEGLPAPEGTAPMRGPGVRQTGTILLVEDHDDLRGLLVELLEGEGHSVIAKATAHDALAWAAKAAEPPDLLLTDADLLGAASGVSLALDLPGVLNRSVPTIILTGDITTATLQCISATSFNQISKPVAPEVLLERISGLLQESRAAKLSGLPGPAAADHRVLHVVDDDPMIRATTRHLFEAEGWTVVTHPSAEAFLAAPRPPPGACLVVDGVLPGMNGLALLEVLRAERSTLPAVVLTGHGDIAMAVSAMKAGAADLIEKPARAADLMASVLRAVEGSTDQRLRAASRRAAQVSLADLTPREHDVLVRVLGGTPNKVIAADLGINQRTVENHRAAVMRKTGAASLPELVRLAIAAGWRMD